MKYQTYFFTYAAYGINHAMRMCFSYNKAHVKQTFDVSSFYLGILDASIYISYGIGALLRYSFFGDRNLTRLYLISASLISLFFSFIPLTSLMISDDSDKNSGLIEFIITLSLAGYGFSHLAIWQIMVTLMSQHWHAHKEGCMMGFWATMSCTGNIFGFFIPNFMIYTLNLRWQLSMLFFGLLNFIIALLMYLFLANPEQQIKILAQIDQDKSQDNKNQESKKPKQQNEQKFSKKVSTQQFWKFSKAKFYKQSDYRIYIYSYVTLKAVVYSYLMWYPIYLSSQGFDNISGYISMLFDISSIIGGGLIGKLAQFQKLAYQQNLQLFKGKFYYSIFILIVKFRYFFTVVASFFLVLFYVVVPGSPFGYCLITILLGLTIGGMFHLYVAFNMMIYGGQTPRTVDMVSNFCISIGCIGLGVFQLIIGLVTNLSNKSVKEGNYKNFFYLLLLLIAISSVLLFIRSKIISSNYQEKRKLNQQNVEQNLDQVGIN